MSRRKSISNHSEETFAKYTSTFINSAYDYRRIMSENTYLIVRDIALAKGAPFGALFLSIITTINYIAAAAKVKIQMAATSNQWTMNLNTYAIFIGPPSCGKTPTIKAAVMDPLKAMPGDIFRTIKGRLTMSALADALSNKETGNNVYMVNSEAAETISRHVESSNKKSNGDLALLNQVYSGEDIVNGYTTRHAQGIPHNAALCILGKSIVLIPA